MRKSLINKRVATMTKNAKIILDIINSGNDHLIAEDIYLKMKNEGYKVSPATVYNNLNKLCCENLIRRISMTGSPDRYDRIIRHDHLVCPICGEMSDITLEDLTDKLKTLIGDDFISYDLKINYICDKCKSKGNL